MSSDLEIAHQADFHPVLVYQRRTAAQIYGDHGQRLIHRHYEVSRAIDAFAVAQRLGEQLADYDAYIFNGVVLVDIEIAFGLEREIEAAMLCEQLQHVIEEADPGRDFVLAFAFDLQFARESASLWCRAAS